MAVKQDTPMPLGASAGTPTPARSASAVPPSDDPMVASVLQRLPDGTKRIVAQAPGRLDVMGGLADYTGSLSLNLTIADRVCVALASRRDGMVSVTSVHDGDEDPIAPTVLRVDNLVGSAGPPLVTVDGEKITSATNGHVTGCVCGTLIEAMRAGIATDLGGGFSIVVRSALDAYSEAGADAALAAATLVALARAIDVELDPLEAVAVCHRVETEWLGSKFGVGDAAGVMLGTSNTLTELRCEPCALAGSIPLPDDLVMMGLDCGAAQPDARLKCERVRTATFMGRLLIDRIIRHDKMDHLQWDGYLSRVSMADYVERFRDRIPTRLKGREFLDRFGETGDPLTRIDPDFLYKIRSRAEHHIYENARAAKFAECLSRGIRNADYGILSEAGELMYASHWSYRQRCGLGNVRTDRLVTLIRRHGVEDDLFGAKLSGRSLGSIVTVLLRASQRSAAALADVVQSYQSQTDHTLRRLVGTSPGALASGAQLF